jgi:hypothetical protein
MQKSLYKQSSTLAIRTLGLLSCLVLLCLAGCQTINVKAPFPWDKEKNKPQPDKIMAVWTDAVRTESGKPAERGFGGRIFFYDDKGKTMKAEGTVHIYVFDDDRSLDQVQIPEKKFVFPADTLELRYSKCSLGHSYNFWVPIGTVQGPNRNLSLVTKIELKSGGSVVSTVTRKILPGNGLPNAVTTSKPNPSRIQDKSPPRRSNSPRASPSDCGNFRLRKKHPSVPQTFPSFPLIPVRIQNPSESNQSRLLPRPGTDLQLIPNFGNPRLKTCHQLS